MDLKGWDYQGRNIDTKLLNQFKGLADFISNEKLVNNRTWGKELQNDIADAIGISGENRSGAVRTIKSVLEHLGFINYNSLSERKIPTFESVISPLGQDLLTLISVENDLNSLEEDDPKGQAEIKALYQDFYARSLLEFYFPFGVRKKEPAGKNKPLHPLRATIKALKKFGYLNKWEWYLLNTIIDEDDNLEKETELENAIKDYRDGIVNYSMQSIKLNPKGHQYFPQYLGLSGLVSFKKKGREWTRMELNEEYNDLFDIVLSDSFIRDFYAKKQTIIGTQVENEEDNDLFSFFEEDPMEEPLDE
ncbi:hypothetical protein EXW96_26735 [Paenibacillus sp. JMULE4]|uniref:hypothetical protein n=1 Tax=Paenibacillus sp. JMULE4 TaxID=2518342 RepID=UPI0015753FBF|nr:hypothetical protein [Paenibacillus sp. JMULE4]NTZ20986.1 hypothetical protein [Paenibacillus sp. JMULE4]